MAELAGSEDRMESLQAVAQGRALRAGQRPALPPPEGVELRRSVVYGRAGGRELTLDLFLPDEGAWPAPRPAMLFFHGGAWSSGTPGQFYRQSGSLAAAGIACASVSYRLSGEAKYPAAVEDAKCAVRWMRAHAQELGVDPERIGCAGASAGGHLAAMLATTAGIPRFEGSSGHADASSRVCLAVLFNPVLDLVALAGEERCAEWLISFLGVPFEGNEALYRDASPITHVGPETPPCLLFHGMADKAVPYAQAERFRDVLRQNGVAGELVSYEGRGHGFFSRSPYYEETYTRMEGWLLDRFGQAAGRAGELR
mgnify:FL=1